MYILKEKHVIKSLFIIKLRKGKFATHSTKVDGIGQ